MEFADLFDEVEEAGFNVVELGGVTPGSFGWEADDEGRDSGASLDDEAFADFEGA